MQPHPIKQTNQLVDQELLNYNCGFLTGESLCVTH